jgi:hypothetical protein
MRNIASRILPAAKPAAGVVGSARMAELVDASDSKSGYRKVVQVRFLFRAQRSFKTTLKMAVLQNGHF